MRKIKSLLFVALVALWSMPAKSQNIDCQAILNSLLSGMGGPGNYSGGAEDLANIYNTYCQGGQRSQQPQQPMCPAGTSFCAQVNLCCGAGSYCSKYGCTPVGAVDCGNSYCNPGMQCTSNGRCMPAGNTECGNSSCAPGSHCGSRNQCMAQGTTDCGNGTSCPDGKKCSRDLKFCLAQDTVDCGSHFCNRGYKCGSGNSCLSAGDVDCGKGNSCPAGSLCRNGGGCVTREQLAAEKAAADKAKADAAKALADKKAAEKAAAEKAAAEKAAEAKARQEKIAADKAAATKAAADKIAAEKAATAKAKADKIAAERAAADKATADKVAAQKAAADKAYERRRNIAAVKPSGVQQSVLAWNAARMREAKPAAMPQVKDDFFNRQPVAPAAPPSSMQGGSPEYGRGPSGSGVSYQVPLKWAGKLFFSTREGDQVCSGQFIAPRVVLTAAHCVRDNETGKFHDNVAFMLQYESGNYSDRYGGICIATPEGWVQAYDARFRWDYALILTYHSSLTGHFGWRSDWNGSFGAASKIGYPGDIAGGEIVQIDQGPLTVRGSIVQMRHGNPLHAKGSSGGAWVGSFSATTSSNENFAISISSYINRNAPGVAYGPYFDHDFVRLFEYVEGGCK